MIFLTDRELVLDWMRRMRSVIDRWDRRVADDKYQTYLENKRAKDEEFLRRMTSLDKKENHDE